MAGGGRKVRRRLLRRLCAMTSISTPRDDAGSMSLAAGQSPSDLLGMAGDDVDDFHIRIGRSRSRGARADSRSQPFVKQVQAAVRRAGGNPTGSVGRPGREAGGSMPEAGVPGSRRPSPRPAADGSGILPGGSDRGGSSSRRGSSSSIRGAGRAVRRCGARPARQPTPICAISSGTG
jgi:hypothetical protein